jgi:hypothetical protein
VAVINRAAGRWYQPRVLLSLDEPLTRAVIGNRVDGGVGTVAGTPLRRERLKAFGELLGYTGPAVAS